MVIGDPDLRSTPRKQAWVGLLLLGAALAAAAWYGTYHQALAEREAFARCSLNCARPAGGPIWAFAVVAALLATLAVIIAARADERRKPPPGSRDPRH